MDLVGIMHVVDMPPQVSLFMQLFDIVHSVPSGILTIYNVHPMP